LAEYTRGASLFSRYRDIAGELQFRAAECQDKLGNAKAAQAAYQRVIDLYPNTDWARRSQEKLTAAAASTAGQ
jgi:TolA-binding protein